MNYEIANLIYVNKIAHKTVYYLKKIILKKFIEKIEREKERKSMKKMTYIFLWS